MGLMLAAGDAPPFFVGAAGALLSAGPEVRVLESGPMWEFLVFAGPFALLALRPRR